MDKKYLKYSIEELMQDRIFVSWVLHKKRNKEWQAFLGQNPEFGKSVKTACKIIRLLEDSYDIFSEEDVYKLWMNIDHFDDQQKQKAKMIRQRRVLHYAAVGFLIAAISGLSMLYFTNPVQPYQFAKTSISESQPSESRLILSTGEEINLKKDQSTVTLENEKIHINNDSIIDLRNALNSDVPSDKLNEVIVPYGKRSQLILEDGTKVWLNAGSHFAFPTQFKNKSRTVFLEGEAYFEVAHNEQCPFLVQLNELEVRVLGTKFNVSAYSSDKLIEAVLLEGKVSIKETETLGFMKKDVLLSPSQRAVYNKEEKITHVDNQADPDITIAWINGWFSFSQQSLLDVLKKLERYYNVKFIYDVRFSSNELITGKMDLKDSLEDVLTFLSDLAKVDFRINNDKIFIERKIGKMPMRK